MIEDIKWWASVAGILLMVGGALILLDSADSYPPNRKQEDAGCGLVIMGMIIAMALFLYFGKDY